MLLLLGFAACSHPASPSAPKRRAGEMMIEVGMRFERSQRAVAAGRWELAAYDTHELREVFEDDLLPGKWADNPTMAQQAKAFLAGPLPQLEADARTHDRAAWDTAFATTVKACNACHDAGHVAFIVIGDDGALRVTR